MRRLIPVLLLFAAACASSSDSGKTTAKVEVALPELQIQQLSANPPEAQHITGGLQVEYALAVQNKASDPITLKQVSIVSLGTGAYNVSTSQGFKTVIQPAQTETVQFWAAANVPMDTVVGVNGPVTLRVTAQFDSPKGSFQEVVVQQVNPFAGIGN